CQKLRLFPPGQKGVAPTAPISGCDFASSTALSKPGLQSRNTGAAYTKQGRGFLQRGPGQGRQEDGLCTSEFFGVLRMRDRGASASDCNGIDSVWSGHAARIPF